MSLHHPVLHAGYGHRYRWDMNINADDDSKSTCMVHLFNGGIVWIKINIDKDTDIGLDAETDSQFWVYFISLFHNCESVP